ncbi:acyl-CoA thioesterase II [Phycicoccus endophyticus]|uniref:Acyl-CoA thioesterase 2 n=1 Tax=Phycicoccus endophyticus TaxID=1690220 RepID=A0A7G9R3D3_9MICO|nr:acyl-CoA thioesterase II [Phycicoccus endophyticus]NHI19861.1 acyl-CoA thioesterase II [Phycicoccus endophyticus]QNN50108.1 acyl-CoA thioesterase II [Phycicoccus endophyticus]
MTDPHPDPLTDLLQTLDLDELGSARVSVQPRAGEGDLDIAIPETFAEDVTLFRGRSQRQPHGRVFGGQVLAQGVLASGRTVTGVGETPRRLHSLHAYFMRPGDDTQPITFSVERMRDGRSFSTRRVHAIQHGKPILSMSASFQAPDAGLDHQDAPPAAPPPQEVRSLREVLDGIDDPRARHISRRAIELRHVEGNLFTGPPEEAVAAQRVWMRAVGRLPDDPLVHDAVLAYASDYSLLEPILRRHGVPWATPGLKMASLDHAMWFHRPARADEWVLYAQESPSAQSGRGLGLGRMFTADGTLVATVAQEGMVRVPG